MNILAYENWLMNIDISSKTRFLLEERLGDAENIYKYSVDKMLKHGLITQRQAGLILEAKKNIDLYSAMESLERADIRLISHKGKEYFKGFTQIDNPPYAYYERGKPLKVNNASISVIGSRSCSSYGELVTKIFIKEFVENKLSIISGMAYGIDSIAQRETIKNNGYTVAVLGSGINVCYPKSHKNLYMDILENGTIISEYGLNISPKTYHFPERNRLISALGEGVLVVEARKKSGTLITVEHALAQGKDVFVIPGRITDKLSEGTNYLISVGAYPANRPSDVLEKILDTYEDKNQLSSFGTMYSLEKAIEKLNYYENSTKIHNINLINDNEKLLMIYENKSVDFNNKYERKEEKFQKSLASDFDLVYSMICFKDIHIDEITEKTGLLPEEIMRICVQLELGGYIRAIGGGVYSRN